MSLDIQAGDTVKIIGPSKYGFTDRIGEITHVLKVTVNGYAVPPKTGTPADLYMPKDLELVAKGQAVITQ